MARIGDQPIERARGIRLSNSVFVLLTLFYCFCVFLVFFLQNFDILSCLYLLTQKSREVPGGSGRLRDFLPHEFFLKSIGFSF